jgi:hypothetical protein
MIFSVSRYMILCNGLYVYIFVLDFSRIRESCKEIHYLFVWKPGIIKTRNVNREKSVIILDLYHHNVIIMS